MSDLKYKITGYSSSDNNIPEEGILENITEDKTVYCCWKELPVQYWYVEGELKATTYYDYGTIPEYPNGTPVHSKGAPFIGWSPALTGVSSQSTSYYASFYFEGATIADPWALIHENTSNGIHATKYKIGDTKYQDYGNTYGSVLMEIVAFDADTTNSITWISKDLLKGTYKWKDSSNLDNGGGYPLSYVRTIVETAIAQVVGEDPRPFVTSVNKTYRMGSGNGSTTDSSSYQVWVPSLREICGWDTSRGVTQYVESSGPMYNGKFNSYNACVKHTNGTNTAARWWLRSAGYVTTNYAVGVNASGQWSNDATTDKIGVPIGFVTT